MDVRCDNGSICQLCKSFIENDDGSDDYYGQRNHSFPFYFWCWFWWWPDKVPYDIMLNTVTAVWNMISWFNLSLPKYLHYFFQCLHSSWQTPDDFNRKAFVVVMNHLKNLIGSFHFYVIYEFFYLHFSISYFHFIFIYFLLMSLRTIHNDLICNTNLTQHNLYFYFHINIISNRIKIEYKMDFFLPKQCFTVCYFLPLENASKGVRVAYEWFFFFIKNKFFFFVFQYPEILAE